MMQETEPFALPSSGAKQDDNLEWRPAGGRAGFGAPGVVVSYTDDPQIRSGRKFAEEGMQIAAGVPLAVGEGDGFSTFRLGLFGLDKLKDVDGTVARLEAVLDQVM